MAQEDFTQLVHRHFQDMSSRGMEANEACALALKVSAGLAEPPLYTDALLASLDAAATSHQYDAATSTAERFFSSPDSLYAAFWVRHPLDASDPMDTSTSSASTTANSSNSSKQLQRVVSDVSGLGVGSGGVGSNPNGRRSGSGETNAADIDFSAVYAMYDKLLALKNAQLLDAVAAATDVLLGALGRALGRASGSSGGGSSGGDGSSANGTVSAAAMPGLCRQLAIVMANPMLEDSEYSLMMGHVASTVSKLVDEPRRCFVDMLATYSSKEMQRVVGTFQQFITMSLYQAQAITGGVEDATKALALLHEANSRSSAVPYSLFYNDAINNEDFNLKEDFRRWKSPFKYDFSFCKYPFVYDPASKARILQMENQMAQFNELNSALFRGLFSMNGPGSDMCPFLVLKVRRGPYLIQDTLIQINRAKDSDSLKKALKVKFLGEEGVDEGGVQKEFFQLLVRGLFNPDYGMFTYDESTRLNWFRPSRIEMDTEFELVGILIGLAIYNAHILDFSFPLVLYKKLMGLAPSFEDLAELQPEVASSLQKLLDYTGDVEKDFGLFFQVEQEMGFGEVETIDLLPNGGRVAVTNSNREHYVRLHTKHLLETSIAPQFNQFYHGFLRLCSGTALSWFKPEELELLVCGSRQLDLAALEGVTLYDDGYTKESQPVRWFWEVVHSFREEQKKRLLFFVTGSDRVPIKGLAHLNPPFVVSRAGAHSDRLPSAHTCFNHLLLPDYSSLEVLKDRLELAIENAEGFGLM